jgi:chemosensory pili system protein ChpA (sensor histidine kinase/response regulator)
VSGRSELDPEIAAVFLDEARGYLIVLENRAASLDDKIAAAHALKTSAGLVGEGELRAAAEEAERLLRAREAEAATAPVARAEQLLRALAEAAGDPAAGGALGPDSGFDADEARLLRGFFLDEANEHLETIARLLQELEQRPARRELVDELLRKTHTLKGSAATVGLRAAAEAAHRLEDAFAQVRAGRLPMSADTVDALVAAVDLVRAIASADEPGATADLLDRLVVSLAELLRAHGGGPPPRRDATPTGLRERPAPPAHPPPVADAVPTPVEGGSSGRLRITRLTRGDSSSGPHPEPVVEDASRDEEVLFEDRDRRTADRRHEPHILRVDAARVDTLMDAVGELVFDRTRLERRGQELRTLARELSKTRAALRLLLAPLRAATQSAQAGVPPSLEAVTALTTRVLEIESELAGHSAGLSRTTQTLLDDTEALRRTSSQLQSGLTQVRMTSMRSLFSRLAGPLRESARRAGKRVELATAGEDTELDKTVVEQIIDPLVQILRNAVVHGIERPEVRAIAGKPTVGRITMSARHQGDSVYLEVADDGAGIDVARLRQRLVSLGRVSPEQAAAMKPERVVAAIFEPGISTRDEADELAGRGVGLDVVRDGIARLGGDISVESSPGDGTRFIIRLPLTTAITQALLFKVGGQVYALPNVHVVETAAIEASTPAMPTHLTVRDEPVPLVSLHELLGAEPPHDARRIPAVVLKFAGRKLAATCDKVVGPREIVVKSIGPLLAPLGIYAGATISGAGKVQLILDPAALAQLAYPAQALGGDAVPAGPMEGATSTAAATPVPIPPQAMATDPGFPMDAGPAVSASRRVGRDTGGVPALRSVSGQMAAVMPPRRILVADDSKSVREAVTRMLASAGYIVDVAQDGWEAWEMLQDVDYDLLVTDLEMPRVGGFELIEKIRRDERWRALPVMVISSRSGEPQRQRASQAGANAFQPKPVSRPALLDQIALLLR